MTYHFYGSQELAMAMARNFLGADQAPEESDLADVFKEAANVIAGNLVTALACGGTAEHGIPHADKVERSEEASEVEGIVFTIDDEALQVAVVSSNG